MEAGRAIAKVLRTDDRTSGGPEGPRSPWRTPLVVTGIVGTSVATVLELADRESWVKIGLPPPWEFFEEHPWMGVVSGVTVVVACACIWSRKPLHRILQSWVRLNQHHHLDPHRSGVSPRALWQLVTEDRLMLGYSVRELARRARVPQSVLWCIILNPQFLPRAEYIDRICEVLLTRPQHLRDGSGYGAEFITQRLMRYYNLGFLGHTMHPIVTKDEAAQLSMLSTIENKRREKLGLTLPQGES